MKRNDNCGSWSTFSAARPALPTWQTPQISRDDYDSEGNNENNRFIFTAVRACFGGSTLRTHEYSKTNLFPKHYSPIAATSSSLESQPGLSGPRSRQSQPQLPPSGSNRQCPSGPGKVASLSQHPVRTTPYLDSKISNPSFFSSFFWQLF